MTNDTPFNPLPLPEGLVLNQNTGEDAPPGHLAGHPQQKKPSEGKSRSKRRLKTDSGSPEPRAQNRWRDLTNQIAARLCQMDPKTLKRTLIGAGVAAGVIMAILIAVKLTPVSQVLLALLGLAFLLRLWDKLF